MLRMLAQKLLVATAQDMPSSRWLRGKTSAEYWCRTVSKPQRDVRCRGRTYGERHGTLAGTVERGEEIDEECDHSEMRFVLLGDVEAESAGQERPEHVREGEEEQASSAEGVNRPDGRPGEDEVDQAEAESCHQRSEGTGTRLFENGRRVETKTHSHVSMYFWYPG